VAISIISTIFYIFLSLKDETRSVFSVVGLVEKGIGMSSGFSELEEKQLAHVLDQRLFEYRYPDES